MVDFSVQMGPRLGLIEFHRLKLGKNGSNKNLRLDSQQEPIGIVGEPDRSAAKFSVRLKFPVFSDLVQLQIEFDRIVGSRGPDEPFATKYRDGRQISGCRWIDDNSLNIAILKRVAFQVEQCGIQIEKIGRVEPPDFRTRACPRCLGFPRGDAAGIERQPRDGFLVPNIFCLLHFDRMQCARIHP